MASIRKNRTWSIARDQFGMPFGLIVFALAVHSVNHSVRALLLASWALASIPLFLSGIALELTFAFAVTGVSVWFAFAYCGDMGGEYSHDILAGIIGLETLVFGSGVGIASFVKLFSNSHRTRTRSLLMPGDEKWQRPLGLESVSNRNEDSEPESEIVDS